MTFISTEQLDAAIAMFGELSLALYVNAAASSVTEGYGQTRPACSPAEAAQRILTIRRTIKQGINQDTAIQRAGSPEAQTLEAHLRERPK